MKYLWMAIVVTCLAGAAMALWRQQLSAAFVIATIGVLAGFLRYRGELKESLAENGSPLTHDPEANSADEDS